MSKSKLLTSHVNIVAPLVAAAYLAEELVGVIAHAVIHHHHLTHQCLNVRSGKPMMGL